MGKESLPVHNLPKVETFEQAREVLPRMDEQQEITATSDKGSINIKKHNDHEFSAGFVNPETGIISLRDASHILLEHGDHDFYLGRLTSRPPGSPSPAAPSGPSLSAPGAPL